MTSNEMYLISKCVLEFLEEDTSIAHIIKTFNTHAFVNMESALDGSGYDMVDFTIMINNKLNILPSPLWGELPTEFFSNEKAIDFYKNVISLLERKKKIEKLLNI